MMTLEAILGILLFFSMIYNILMYIEKKLSRKIEKEQTTLIKNLEKTNNLRKQIIEDYKQLRKQDNKNDKPKYLKGLIDWEKRHKNDK